MLSSLTDAPPTIIWDRECSSLELTDVVAVLFATETWSELLVDWSVKAFSNQARLTKPNCSPPSPPFPQWSAFTLLTSFYAKTHLPEYKIQYRRWHQGCSLARRNKQQAVVVTVNVFFFLDLRSLQRSSHLPFYFPKYRGNQRMKWTCVLPIQWFPAICN